MKKNKDDRTMKILKLQIGNVMSELKRSFDEYGPEVEDCDTRVQDVINKLMETLKGSGESCGRVATAAIGTVFIAYLQHVLEDFE